MTDGGLIYGMICHNRDMRREVFGYLDLATLFHLACVNNVLRTLLADDRRLRRIKNFLDAHVGRSVNYNRIFDVTTSTLVKDGDLSELEFVYSVFDKDAEASNKNGRVRKWLEEGFAQSWMFDKPAHARWFAITNVDNALFVHKFYGCVVSLSTVTHCVFVSCRMGDERKKREIYLTDSPSNPPMDISHYSRAEYMAEIVDIKSLDEFKAFLYRPDVTRWVTKADTIWDIRGALKGGRDDMIRYINDGG